jgi:hypothetical protein
MHQGTASMQTFFTNHAHRMSQGSIHEGLPQGKEELICGLNTYVVGNRTNPRGIIVIYSDVFGLPLPNNRLIADAYSKSGEWRSTCQASSRATLFHFRLQII